MRVLLVEDSPADARLFAELLSELAGRPLSLTRVETLAAGIDAAAQHEVVFLDLSLPDAHGLDTVSQMVSAARNIPIVVLTGNDDDRLAVDAVKAGAQDYLTKSEITPSLIARTARYAVERKAAEENARRLAKSDEAERRARFISSLTDAITSSLDLDVTLGQAAKLLVPTLGDYAALDLVRDNGRVERVAVATSDHELEIIAPEVRACVTEVIQTREPAFVAVSTHPAHGYVLPLIARGRVVGAMCLGITRSKRTYDAELCQLATEVAERIALGIDNGILYATAQRAIAGRDELLAVVSHDLRNPLNLVGLAIQMIEQDPDSLTAAIPSAKRGVDRMQRLIEDLLDVARIEAGTLTVEPRATSLLALLEDVFEQHRVLAADKRITLVRDYDMRLGGVIADRHRMTQAISNLIGNALKFTPACGSIRVGGESRGERATIWVTDTGPGIPTEHIARIFDRFWQPKRGHEGVGLGLAIVKGIVDAHGGKIDVESADGSGTTFRIVLRSAELRPTSESAPLAHA